MSDLDPKSLKITFGDMVKKSFTNLFNKEKKFETIKENKFETIKEKDNKKDKKDNKENKKDNKTSYGTISY